ncbi:MAG: glycerate kinase [Dehalococcoidia bacterium]|nr:glycerate kinase [Dehalococcoidia bacterium]
MAAAPAWWATPTLSPCCCRRCYDCCSGRAERVAAPEPARTLRVLVCPQEFKGSLTAAEAARAIAEGVRRALPDAAIEQLPMADGGPGTLDIACAAAHGELVEGRASGPLGEPLRARWALLPGGRALAEAAATAGLLLTPERERDPARASTRGVGEQIAQALRRGVREIVTGVGGTGTNDGGAGALAALGYRILDAAGAALGPGGLALARLARIDASAATRFGAGAPVVRVAVDVTNPLLGPHGATLLYGPQKGVTPQLAPRLEAALAHWAECCRRDLGVAIAELEGGGAGGGLAAGLAAAGATIEGGAALVGGLIGLPARIAAADLVVTGEGRLDAQTAYGKSVAYVAALAREARRRCVAVAGSIEAWPDGIADAEAAAPAALPLAQAMRRAPELVAAAAERLARRAAGGIDARGTRP